MPLQELGCFVKWFYLVLIVQTILCLGHIECRQNHNRHNNNNNNRRGDSISSEENHSLGDDVDNIADSDSSIGAGHSAGGGGGGGGFHRRSGRRRAQGGGGGNRHNRNEESISLWINEQQLKMLSALYFPQGYSDRIYAIHNGRVTNEMRDTTFYNYLVIPSEVNYVNFTWKSGKRKYFYDFDRLQTMDESILKAPTLSINKRGRIPQEQKNFSIFLPCTGNSSGTASFNVGLKIQTKKNKPLSGTPIRLNFKKECAHRGVYDIDASNPTSLTTLQAPDPECTLKCGKNGYCNEDHICKCNVGYTGQYCETAFCFPQCLNGGNCTEPSKCTCPDGYQGTQCEGGICKEKCLNGGKCIQKDKCQCSKGYYGLHCEYSKCVIPCKNGGRCIGNNMCRCPNGLDGHHCEIGRKQRSTCKCSNGVCLGSNKECKCQDGYQGRHCRRRKSQQRRHYG
ncbi:protein shifted isoform X1 [Drosophila nasuta]|uniref:protein shifted isoform X1 n=1 Tax=Drosophila nasuta TaxID=42062 RepID=UPI00295E8F8B|nr:protein shifted isoform X1 [Drosophila nasuta]XP_060663806.1 protein shifted isoform X1 [Drosophila nasuta]